MGALKHINKVDFMGQKCILIEGNFCRPKLRTNDHETAGSVVVVVVVMMRELFCCCC